MTVTIKNLRNSKPTHPWDVKIDRTSPLGNPFVMGKDGGRDDVCDAYSNRFERIQRKAFTERLPLELFEQNFLHELDRIDRLYIQYGEVRLFCWCAPSRCHAETIKNYLERE